MNPVSHICNSLWHLMCYNKYTVTQQFLKYIYFNGPVWEKERVNLYNTKSINQVQSFAEEQLLQLTSIFTGVVD